LIAGLFALLGCKAGDKGGSVLEQHGYSMIQIDAGEFWMGSPVDELDRDEGESRHLVALSRGFSLGSSEVTQGLWETVMGDSPAAERQEFYRGESHGSCAAVRDVSLVGDDLPIQCVDWFEAVRFCNRLSGLEGLEAAYTIAGDSMIWDRNANGFRLPTEAEWEYAARAGGDDRYSGTDDAAALCRYANVADSSAKTRFAQRQSVIRITDNYISPF